VSSQIIALLVPPGCRKAALLVRRGDGQIALEGIDARVACATRIAANWFRRGPAILDPAGHEVEVAAKNS